MRALSHSLGVLLVALMAGDADAAQDGESGCVVCHGAEVKLYKRSVHAEAGVGCVDCHGGDPDTLEIAVAHGTELRTFADPPDAVDQCARCHSDSERMRASGLRTDQRTLFATSRHGILLAEDAEAQVATCVSCHGGHAVFRATDPRSPVHKFNQPATCGACHSDPRAMEPYGLGSDVVDEFRASVHGTALLEHNRASSPACTDCHGSHSATPPGVDAVGRVCGHCHSVVQRFFEESPHLEAARRGEIEECISCHGYHHVAKPSAAMLVGAGPGHCATCHEDADGLGVAAALHAGVSELDAEIDRAQELIQRAGAEGLFMEREHGYLDDARSLRARARSMTHALSPTLLADLLSRGHGMIEQTRTSLRVKERNFRDRKIFTAIFLGATALLAGVLQVYRREVFGTRIRPNAGATRARSDG